MSNIQKVGLKPRCKARWDDHKEQRLAELLHLGLSFQACADAMGLSKNSVSGRAYAIGLCTRPGRPHAQLRLRLFA